MNMNLLRYWLIFIACTASIAVQADEPHQQSTEPQTVHPQEPGSTVASQAQLSLDDMRTFTDAFNQIRLNHVEEVDDHTLLNAAIAGMLSELDPHSAFMQSDQFQRLEDDSMGRYSGIGVEVSSQDQRLSIIDVMPGGAAEKAGIKAGDVITSIDRNKV